MRLNYFILLKKEIFLLDNQVHVMNNQMIEYKLTYVTSELIGAYRFR